MAFELESDLQDTGFSAGKTQVFSFDQASKTGAIDVRMDGSIHDGLFLRKNHLWRYWGWLYILNGIGVLILSLLLIQSQKKTGALFCFVNFLSPEVALCLCKSTICLCMEPGVPSCFFKLLDKLQKQTSRTVRPSFSCYLSSTLGSSSSIGITLVDVHLNWLN